MSTATLIALIAAFAGPLGAYLIAAKRFSGKIETSDARALWEESSAIRDWSQKRIEELNRVIGDMEERIKELERSNSTLILENHNLLTEVTELKGKTPNA